MTSPSHLRPRHQEADGVVTRLAAVRLGARRCGREWDVVMTRDGRWARVSTGITDPDEVHRQLDWHRLSNRSVTVHVLERTTALREQLVDEHDVPQP